MADPFIILVEAAGIEHPAAFAIIDKDKGFFNAQIAQRTCGERPSIILNGFFLYGFFFGKTALRVSTPILA